MALFQTTTKQQTMFAPVLDSPVDYETETVEGRIGKLLEHDDRGDYKHALVKQAQERQLQAFNGRGLLNSSMAMQAAQEGATSKAIDIAAPDAQTYFNNRRGNADTANTFARDEISNNFQLGRDKDQQAFQTREGYQKAMQAIGTNYQRQIDTINASNMDPADKTVAIQQAGAVRDGELAFQNNLYSRMPQWQNEWLAAAVPTGSMDIANVTNIDTLSNIVNDPAQTQAMRDAAQRQIEAIRGGNSAGVGGGGPGGAGGQVDAQGFPVYVAGQPVNWDAPVNPTIGTFMGLGGARSLREAYTKYRATGGMMSPYEWAMSRSSTMMGPGFGPGNGTNDAAVDGANVGPNDASF